jgi:hypothetical protein
MRIVRVSSLLVFSFLSFATVTHAQGLFNSGDGYAGSPRTDDTFASTQRARSSTAISAIQDFSASGSITDFWTGQNERGDLTVKGRRLAQFGTDASLPHGIRALVVNGSNGPVKDIDGTTRTLPSDILPVRVSPTQVPDVIFAEHPASASRCAAKRRTPAQRRPCARTDGLDL